jgi:plastocyanin
LTVATSGAKLAAPPSLHTINHAGIVMRTATTAVVAFLTLTVWCGATGSAGAGTIKGTVRLAGGPVEVKKLKVTVDHTTCGTTKDVEDVVASPDMGLHNVVVSLVTPPPDAKWSVAPTVQMDAKQCVFVPRVVVVPARGTVEFLNSDRLRHNIHSVGRDNPIFNRTQPKGRTIPIAFRRPEIIRIDCDLHPWMRAWVVVAEHPFYAVTNDRGEFALENVPPGTYTLQVWHETLGVVKKDVAVSDGVTAVTVEMVRK